jgi:hypothetical protein
VAKIAHGGVSAKKNENIKLIEKSEENEINSVMAYVLWRKAAAGERHQWRIGYRKAGGGGVSAGGGGVSEISAKLNI